MSPLEWAGPPIQVIGVAAGAGGDLAAAPRRAIANAEILIGSKRHLEAIAVTTGDVEARTLEYPSPFERLADTLHELRGKRVAMLASGDPLLYGIGTWLTRHVNREHLVFHPNVSSIQVAFARLGISWQEAKTVSLHGRPLGTLRRCLRARRLYALLTDTSNHPGAIAAELCDCRFPDSTLWVAEDLGLASERIREFRADRLAKSDPGFSPLNVVILRTCGSGGVMPEFPGIPDGAFGTDRAAGRGMLSKREVRIVALSLLQPSATEIGWDLGAGCGGIAVEWALWSPFSSVHALEQHPGRIAQLRANRDRFGVNDNLLIHEGRAPQALAALPDPDAVFLGGSDGELGAILDSAWSRLPPSGRLVSAAVTLESRSGLVAFAAGKSAEWLEISVGRGDRLGTQHVLRPSLPVLLVRLVKA